MTTVGDQEETARLWKVNRTIHELVKDRVSDQLHRATAWFEQGMLP